MTTTGCNVGQQWKQQAKGSPPGMAPRQAALPTAVAVELAEPQPDALPVVITVTWALAVASAVAAGKCEVVNTRLGCCMWQNIPEIDQHSFPQADPEPASWQGASPFQGIASSSVTPGCRVVVRAVNIRSRAEAAHTGVAVGAAAVPLPPLYRTAMWEAPALGELTLVATLFRTVLRPKASTNTAV